MFRIDGPNTVPVKPAYGAAGTQGWFKNYGVGGTLDGPGTIVTPDWFNMIQAELLAVITDAGLTADKGNDAQLLAALNAKFSRGGVGDLHITFRSSPAANELRPNGAAINRVTYAALFAQYGETFGAGDGVNTFNLPLLGGEFMRIFDDARGIDAGRTLRSFQLDALQGHWHQVEHGTGALNDIATYNALAPGSGQLAAGSNGGTPGAVFSIRAPRPDGTNGTPRIAAETRGRNVAVNAFVRFI